MNLSKICQLYNTGIQIANRIGGRNIIFFGLLGTAVAAEYAFHYLVSGYLSNKNLITASTSLNESNPPKPFTNIHID